MKYEKRFEARETTISTVGAKIESKTLWRVYDYKTKGWWKHPSNTGTNVVDATRIADSLNNGHIRP